jgi:hypothetical protein
MELALIGRKTGPKVLAILRQLVIARHLTIVIDGMVKGV